MRTEKTITRTVTTWKITVTTVNLEKREFGEKVVYIPELIPEKKRLDYITEKVLTNGDKALEIKSCELNEELYAMSEQDFLKYAHKIEKR